MDIRSSLHKRMTTLKEKKEVKIDYKKIPTHVSSCIRYSSRIARCHPFLTGLALFLLLLYSYFPSLFSFLISSSPVIICTTLLLGTLLSYGEPYIPEIDEEEMKMSHDVSSQQAHGVSDDLASKKEEEFFTESVAFSKRDLEEDPTVSLQVNDEDTVGQNANSSLQIRDVSDSSTVTPEEDNVVVKNLEMGYKNEIEDNATKPQMPFHGFPEVDDTAKYGPAFLTMERSIKSKKDVLETEDFVHNHVIDVTEISALQFPVLTAEVKKEATSTNYANGGEKEELEIDKGERVERKDAKDEFFEKIYIHEEMLAEDASVGAESVPDLDPHASEDMVYVKAETDGTETGICYYSLLSTKKSVDGADDSGSDVGESSSSDASMADIIPMLDELRPFLDADLTRPVHIHIDGNDDEDDNDHDDDDDDDNDDGDDDDDAFEESSHDSKSESASEEHVAEDHSHLVAPKEKPTESEFVLSWTPDDEKNLMDLGSSELERNQRLENMIAKRRARKDLENSMGLHPFHADAALMAKALSHLSVQVPPISVRRNNPFDYHYDSEELKGLPPVPGSAPSVFSRRRNPFEFPYWETNDSHNNTADGLRHPEFVSQRMGSSSESFGGFAFGPSSLVDHKEVKPDGNDAPHFSTAKTEAVTLSKYERQLSRLSDPRLSSISEPEPVSPGVQGCDEGIPVERSSFQENHMFSASNHVEDVTVQSEQEERNAEFSSIRESLGISTSPVLAQKEIKNELEPVKSDTPQSKVVEGECDESDASVKNEDIISASDQEITFDPLSTECHLSTDSSASLNPASQESDAQPDNIGLPDQDLNLADKAFITVHRSIEGSVPYDIENLSKDDAAWLREIAEMRKVDLSGKSEESETASNVQFASISSTEPESYEQLQINTVQKLDTPRSYFQELAPAGKFAGCASEHPCLPVDEPVPLPSFSCGSESTMDILPPIPEEIAADSNHEEHHGTLGTMIEKSNGLSDDLVDLSHSVEPLTLLPHISSSTASSKYATVNDGSVNLSINEFETSQLLDIQSYACFIGSGGQFSNDPVGNVVAAATRGNEVKELDEGLLSELDAVGDFSMQNWNSSKTQCANQSISHSILGDNTSSSVIFKEAHAFCENQELSTDISQINCCVSPFPENEISIDLPTKEYKGDDLRLQDSSFEHHYVETSNVQDNTSVLQEPDASSGRNITLDSATDYQTVSQVEFSESGFPAKVLGAHEDEGCHRKMEFYSDIHEVEAESIDDIHRALENFAGADLFFPKQSTNMQFTSSLQDAEAHNLECTDLAIEQSDSVSSSSRSTPNIHDISIEAQSPEILDLGVKHQAGCTSDDASGKLETETFPLLLSSQSSLNEVEASVEDSLLSTKLVLSESVVTDRGRHDVEETHVKDAVAVKRQDDVDSVPVLTATMEDSKIEVLEDAQLTVSQKEISSEPAATCSALPEVEEPSPEDLILEKKDAFSEPVATHLGLPEVEELSLKEDKFVFSQEEKHAEKVAVQSEMHEVEAQSVDDLHALFRQHGVECECWITHSEILEVKEHFADSLVGTKLSLDFSLGQEDSSSNQTLKHPGMHEIEVKSLEDLNAALGRQITEIKSEANVHEIECKSVDEALGKEVQNLRCVVDPLDNHSEEIGGYSKIQEIEARSLDDLHAVFGKHSEKGSPAIDSEPHGFEAPSRNIAKKETTNTDFMLDQQKHAELILQHSGMHEVEAQSLDDLHLVLQQQGVFAETVVCSEPLKNEERTIFEELVKESTDGDSALGQERHSKQVDHSDTLKVEECSLDVLDVGFEQHSQDNLYVVQAQSAKDSIEREDVHSDLLVLQNLHETEELFVGGLQQMDEEQSTQLDVAAERDISSAPLVHPDLHEIEAHCYGDSHLALNQKILGSDTLEKEVNHSESQSNLHEIEAWSLDDLHLALGSQVMPSNLSHIQSGQLDLEMQSFSSGNLHLEFADAQVDLHEIEVHSFDDLHLALGKQGLLSSLDRKKQNFETQSLRKENTHSGSLDQPDVEVCCLDGEPLEPYPLQSDLQKVEERKILGSATEHIELHEIEAQSIKDINIVFEQFFENDSTRDERVEIEQTENLSNEVKSSSNEVCLPESEPCKCVSEVEFAEDVAVISNLDVSSTIILDGGKSDDTDSSSSSSSSESDRVCSY